MSCCDVIVVKQPDGSLKSTPFYVEFAYNYSTERKEVIIAIEKKKTKVSLHLKPGHLRCYFGDKINVEKDDEQHMKNKMEGSAAENVSKSETKEEMKELQKREPQLQEKKDAKTADPSKKSYFSRTVSYLFPQDQLLERMENDKVYSLDHLTPTAQHLTQLNLKPGINHVHYILEGNRSRNIKRQVIEGTIFLWNYKDRIALCDIDGTVTKSDTMGLVFTAVGYYKYVHPGICSLLSTIEKRGYHVLYLTARSISQGHKTRQFIESIRQQNYDMPHGPILTSYNNLYHAAVREYILYRSETFKIQALKGIQSLFPEDVVPFVLGLGNKPTDHESYVAIGIKVDNIFIIDPAGQVKGLKSQKDYAYGGYEEVQHALGDVLPELLLN